MSAVKTMLSVHAKKIAVLLIAASTAIANATVLIA
jgi:hypothetical protein